MAMPWGSVTVTLKNKKEAYELCEKAFFNDGPWMGEPDRVDWVHELSGYPCVILRQPNLLFLRGYVGIDIIHHLYKMDYVMDYCNRFQVHGGITYSGNGEGMQDGPLFKDEFLQYWAFGFDCAHGGDMWATPKILEEKLGKPFALFPGDTYKDIDFVIKECESLADQLFQAMLF